MSHVRIKRTTEYFLEHEGKEYPVEFEPNAHSDAVVQKLKNGKTVVGYLSDDPEPFNPRENDNLGVMVCWHKRYTLGDKHDYEDPDALWRALLGNDEYEALEEKYDSEYAAWHTAHPNDAFSSNAHRQEMRRLSEQKRSEIQEKLTAKGYTILPLYLYDHSGITMSTGAFSCPWDSGQVGYIYAGPEQIEKVGCPADNVVEGLKNEVTEYDYYLTNECYGVCVEVFDARGKRLHADACWGYLGSEWAKEALQDEVKSIAAYETKKHKKT